MFDFSVAIRTRAVGGTRNRTPSTFRAHADAAAASLSSNPKAGAADWPPCSGTVRVASREPPGGISRSHAKAPDAVSYTHLRAHETRHDLVCRLLLEKK